MFQRFYRLAGLLLAVIGLTACNIPTLSSAPPTIYDLTNQPSDFEGKDVTVLGTYLWKPGNPSTAVLLPGVHTSDGVSDAQPIYASVQCQPNGSCAPDPSAVGVPATGAVWLEGFPAEVTADLHQPGDSVWGVVEVTGRFETGSFGPDGTYHYRMTVKEAKAMQKAEREVSAITNKALGGGQPNLFDLADHTADWAGKTVTTQGYYFWSPATSGLLVESVSREKTVGDSNGLSPKPGGRIIALDGFPPDLSKQMHVGPGNSYVWGLVELTGKFETDGQWGPQGQYKQHFTIDNGKVKLLEK